ncbi:MAG: NAD(P)H-dependent oxidoreductase subunit E [Gammaproteobacteria bacterium]
MKRTRGKKGRILGRVMDQHALLQVQELIGDETKTRDMLIEHLHKIQDKYHHISNRHILALAQEMNLPMAEVYETATFYHHFDVTKEKEAPPPSITLRVCESVRL